MASMVHILYIALLIVYIPNSNADIIIDAGSPADCTPFRQILESSLVAFAASYFADNPRGEQAPIMPTSIDPLTAQNLFRRYYGEGASSMGFKETFTRILYSDPGYKGLQAPSNQAAVLEADRVVLRNAIYTYTKAGSYEISREKFGLLLYHGLNEFAGENWIKHRCVADALRNPIEGLIHTELARLRNEVGEFQFGQFLGLGSGTTLAFAIDDTGSMSGEIEAAKRRAFSIIDQRQGSLDQPQNFVLVPFNDPGVGPLTVTHDPKAFKTAISRLYAHGGGDSPELSMRGIQLAVENSNPGSTIFVITDIDAKDIELQDNVVAQAKQKNIKVTFLVTNKFATSMCQPWSGRSSPTRCGNAALKKGYELYEYIARSTGGQILVVSKNDIFKATQVIEASLKQGLVDVLVQAFRGDADYEVTIPVDGSLSELFLQSSGDCADIIVTRPDESEAVQEGEVVVDKLITTRIPVNGTYGAYRMKLSPTGECDITISARSTKGFVKTLAKRQTNAATGETTYERFEGQAIEGDDVVALIDEYGKQPGDTTESIVLYDYMAESTYEILVGDTSAHSHLAVFDELSATSLRLAIRGKDENGHDFQRVSSSSVEYVPLDIDCSSLRDAVFRAGDSTEVDVNILNLGESQSFSIEAGDDKGYVIKTAAKKISIDRDATAKFTISLSSQKAAKTGTVSTVTITANPENGGELVFKQCRLIVGQKETPDIEAFDIVSNINSRYAETSVTSTVYNNASVSRKAEFDVILPVDAFITEFSMTIDNVKYPGSIEEKEKAKRIFEQAQARGYTAGHVAARDKSTTVFRTSVNLAPQKRVEFSLKYQQLLRRSRGNYRQEVIVQTKQPVGKLSVDVYICENRALAYVNVLGFDTEQSALPGLITLPGVAIDQQRTTAHVSFEPNREEQLRLSPFGLNGKFVVEYDVEREGRKEANEVVADGRNFVHFFSPDLEPMSKRVVFLLDNSASMHGRKMEQLRNAMNIIIDGLGVEDHFAVVMFNNETTAWSAGDMLVASGPSKDSAKRFLSEIEPRGSTNIEIAMKRSISILEQFTEESEKVHHPTSDYILLLTDGRPTDGIVSASELVDFIDNLNNQTYGIHTIGFGSLVDASTLAKIAARNKGSSIQIFEDIDADLQIFDFFETIARPMLRDIEILYDPKEVEITSETTFLTLNDGSELIIAGKFLQNEIELRRRRRELMNVMFDFTIRGKGKDDEEFDFVDKVRPMSPSTECHPDSKQIANFTERLYVFMDLQHTVKEINAENNDTIKDDLKEKALNKSLEFGFVTPGITSMVVLKPDEKKEIDEMLAAEEGKRRKEEEAVVEEEDEDDEIVVDEASSFGPPTDILPVLPSPLPFLGEWERPSGLEGRTLSLVGPGPPEPSAAFVRPRMEFFGDPHFVIDLEQQITLCFNWDGYEGQIFNLLHDPVSSVTVNGKIAVLKVKNTGVKKTFVNEVGIRLDKWNMSIQVTCEKIIITDADGDTTTMSAVESRDVTMSHIRIVVHKISKSVGEILIKFAPGIAFRVIRRLGGNHERVLDHLDFSILNKEGISSSAFGVIGQFSKNNGKDKEEVEVVFEAGHAKKASIWYRQNYINVSMKKLIDYNKGKEVECWYAAKLNELLEKGKFRYVLENLFDIPDMGRAPSAKTTSSTPK